MPDSGVNTAIVAAVTWPQMPPGEVALRCSLFRPREMLRTEIAGRRFTVISEGEAQGGLPEDQCIHLEVAIGAHRAGLSVSALLLADWLMALHPSLGHDVIDETMLGMLVELLFARELARLEAMRPEVVAIARRQERRADNGSALQLRCVWGEEIYPAVLSIDPGLDGELGRFMESAPLVRRDLPDLPLSLAVRIGTAVLPLKALAALKRGDVIMPHSPPLAAGTAEAVLAGRWSAPGALAGASFTAQAPLSSFTEQVMESENTIERPDGAEPEEAALETLPVKLVFEVGRCEATLGELRAMGPGHVFDLGRDPKQAVDIVTGGRKVGTGEVVKIGECLGVRVLRFSNDG